MTVGKVILIVILTLIIIEFIIFLIKLFLYRQEMKDIDKMIKANNINEENKKRDKEYYKLHPVDDGYVSDSERIELEDVIWNSVFYGKISYIVKFKRCNSYKMGYITDNGDIITFGYSFDNKNDQYPGIKVGKKYTLDQLGVKTNEILS